MALKTVGDDLACGWNCRQPPAFSSAILLFSTDFKPVLLSANSCSRMALCITRLRACPAAQSTGVLAAAWLLWPCFLFRLTCPWHVTTKYLATRRCARRIHALAVVTEQNVANRARVSRGRNGSTRGDASAERTRNSSRICCVGAFRRFQVGLPTFRTRIRLERLQPARTRGNGIVGIRGTPDTWAVRDREQAGCASGGCQRTTRGYRAAEQTLSRTLVHGTYRSEHSTIRQTLPAPCHDINSARHCCVPNTDKPSRDSNRP